jgi:hypothetical protein
MGAAIWPTRQSEHSIAWACTMARKNPGGDLNSHARGANPGLYPVEVPGLATGAAANGSGGVLRGPGVADQGKAPGPFSSPHQRVHLGSSKSQGAMPGGTAWISGRLVRRASQQTRL